MSLAVSPLAYRESVSGQTLSENLRKAREVAKRSQAEVASVAGVHPQTVSDWERGKYAPEEDRLLKVARYLETTPSALRYGSPAGVSERAAIQFGEPRPSTEPRGVPKSIRVFIAEEVLEYEKAGATEDEIAEARRLLSAPLRFVDCVGGFPHDFNEDDVMKTIRASAKVIRRGLKKLGRAADNPGKTDEEDEEEWLGADFDDDEWERVIPEKPPAKAPVEKPAARKGRRAGGA